ncbi:hypothetical protein PHYBOEH_006592 [Phytophthora boehmeriae]|uniref:RWP-RK domain-containing protein n=1 Tax=Phytophthora boehmeriae TaxID=109152 RepID=A0A8T1WJE8_9STRA|nr:hypothetical protein PHYBOEH_006592 [Phytophthora boehmeriae]
MVSTPRSTAKKSRVKYDFSVEVLKEYSHYRQDEAAKLLDVSSITLKRICSRQKYRWPYRTIKAKLRREARLAEQKRKAPAAFAKRVKTLPPTSTQTGLSESPPELLLLLRTERKVEGSPTSVSSLSLPKSFSGVNQLVHEKTAKRSPLPRFILSDEPLRPTLQILPDFAAFTRLLAQQKTLPPPETPPRANGVAAMRPMHHHPVEHKTSGMPRFSTPQRLPSADFLFSHQPHGCYRHHN